MLKTNTSSPSPVTVRPCPQDNFDGQEHPQAAPGPPRGDSYATSGLAFVPKRGKKCSSKLPASYSGNGGWSGALVTLDGWRGRLCSAEGSTWLVGSAADSTLPPQGSPHLKAGKITLSATRSPTLLPPQQ